VAQTSPDLHSKSVRYTHDFEQKLIQEFVSFCAQHYRC
jgi:hypothetical protein